MSDFVAPANISAKSKPYAKILMKKGPRYVRIVKKQGVTNLVTLSH